MLIFYNINIYCSLYEFEVIVALILFSYDLEFTVAHNLVAVSTGSLLYQVAMNDTVFCYFSSDSTRNTVFNKLINFGAISVDKHIRCSVKSSQVDNLTTGQLEHGYFQFFFF